MLAHKENPQRTLFPSDSRAMAMTKNVQQNPVKMSENGWQFKCATSSIHRKRKKNLLWNNQLVKKGQN